MSSNTNTPPALDAVPDDDALLIPNSGHLWRAARNAHSASKQAANTVSNRSRSYQSGCLFQLQREIARHE
jgi:hypothetical protein